MFNNGKRIAQLEDEVKMLKEVGIKLIEVAINHKATIEALLATVKAQNEKIKNLGVEMSWNPEKEDTSTWEFISACGDDCKCKQKEPQQEVRKKRKYTKRKDKKAKGTKEGK